MVIPTPTPSVLRRTFRMSMGHASAFRASLAGFLSRPLVGGSLLMRSLSDPPQQNSCSMLAAVTRRPMSAV